MSLKPLKIYIVLALIFLTGCEPRPQSENISSSDLYVQFQVTEQINSTSCSAEFANGPKGYLGYAELSGQDFVDCNGVRMNKTDNLIPISIYTAQVPISGNAKYAITLHRANELLVSDVTPLDPLVLQSPAPGSMINRHQALDITWKASSYEAAFLTLSLNTSNNTAGVPTLSGHDGPKETGRFTFQQAAIEGFGSYVGGITLTLQRQLPGNLANPLRGSFSILETTSAQYPLSP